MSSRSHANSPVSPLFNDLTAILPILPKKTHSRSRDDSEIALSSLDPDTSRLLPSRRRKHRVWVQGKLAPVTTVSVASLRGLSSPSTPALPSPAPSSRGPSPIPARFERGVAGIPDRQRPSEGDDVGPDDSEDERETTARDTQLRGYGIGGAGNIRRATDVIHGPNPASKTARRSEVESSRSSETERQRFSLRDMLKLRPDDRNKST